MSWKCGVEEKLKMDYLAENETRREIENADPCIRKGFRFKERGSGDYHTAWPHEELLVVCPAVGEGGLGLA